MASVLVSTGLSVGALTAQARTEPAARPGVESAATTCPPDTAAPSREQMQQDRQQARDRGLLWRLDKDGRTSYLYGTLHVGKAAWVHPGPRLREALAAVDTLALELDPTDPAVQQGVLRAMLVPSRPLPGALRQRMVAQRDAACLPGAAFDRMHPVMQVMTLSMSVARRAGLDVAYGSEPWLAARAKAAGLQVVSLETVERQMQALMPPDKGGQEADLVASALSQLEANRMGPVLRRMVQAWEAGDLPAFESYADWCECVATPAEVELYQRINDERNPDMATAIDALHTRGQRVFAAVGALHMTGVAGLPKLLTQRGYRVQRVTMTSR